jgi:pimeloyl-ACP methyl ester carboxylesterase
LPLAIPEPRTSGFTTTTPSPLYWCEYGPPDAEPLLVLHGGPGAHHDYLLPQYLDLAKKHRLFFYDQRGGGRSRTESQDPITWQTQVHDLALVIKELAITPLDLVGYSWGALLALLYALESRSNPELPAPRRLVLVNPAALTRQHRAEFEAEFQRRQSDATVTQAREELSASGLRERDPEAYRQSAFELSVAGYFADATRSHDMTPFRVIGKTQESIWKSIGDYDVIERLAELNTPSLVVHGWYDPIPVESSYLAARALSARFVVLEASGHVPHVEQQHTLFNVIENFLDDTTSTGVPHHDQRLRS